MTSDKSRLLDDLARMAGGAASLVSTMRRQASADIRERAKSFAPDAPSNEDMNRLQALVSKYRLEQEQMKKRISDLEAAIKSAPGDKARPEKSGQKLSGKPLKPSPKKTAGKSK